ncbi:MAG: glycosyltransferase family 2 protein [Bdellovibrionota bacterium]
MQKSQSLDVVVLTYRRERMLERCLRSLDAAAGANSTRLRAIVVVNGADPATSKTLSALTGELDALEIEVVEVASPLPCGYARNAGVEKARGEWIYFADDDAWVDRDFFVTFASFIAAKPNLAVVGGPNLTDDSMTSFQKTAGAVLGSPFAAGPFSRRYRGGGKVETANDDRGLILCNLFVKRSAFAGYRFPEELSCAEENHLLHFLDSEFPSDGKVFHPGLGVFHERAMTFKRFASSAIRYGRGRGELISLDGWSMKSSKFILFALVFALFAMIAAPLATLLLYATTSFIHAIFISARTRNLTALATAPALTLALHGLYPVGVAVGICQTPLRSFRSIRSALR